MNKVLSNLEIRLDNFKGKPLKLREDKMSMVGEVGLEPTKA